MLYELGLRLNVHLPVGLEVKLWAALILIHRDFSV